MATPTRELEAPDWASCELFLALSTRAPWPSSLTASRPLFQILPSALHDRPSLRSSSLALLRPLNPTLEHRTCDARPPRLSSPPQDLDPTSVLHQRPQRRRPTLIGPFPLARRYPARDPCQRSRLLHGCPSLTSTTTREDAEGRTRRSSPSPSKFARRSSSDGLLSAWVWSRWKRPKSGRRRPLSSFPPSQDRTNRSFSPLPTTRSPFDLLRRPSPLRPTEMIMTRTRRQDSSSPCRSDEHPLLRSLRSRRDLGLLLLLLCLPPEPGPM